MKLWKIALIAVALVLALLQIPGLYNRYVLYTLSSRIAEVEKSPAERGHEKYTDYKGVIHVHSFLGEHSTGTFEELVKAARSNDLHFVVMTEHVSEYFDTSAKTLGDVHGGVVFVGGNEAVSRDGDRFLIAPGFSDLMQSGRYSSRELIDRANEKDSFLMLPYPDTNGKEISGVDSVEVFSLNTNSKNMNIPLFILEALWSYRQYPQLTLARHFQRPNSALQRFDELAALKRTSLFGGTDAHSNIGIHVGDDTNKRYLDLKFDDYDSIFRLVRNHVLIDKTVTFSHDSLMEALKAGRFYVSFDLLGDGTGFYFGAIAGGSQTAMGGAMPFAEGASIEAKSPRAARFLVFRDGKKFFESKMTKSIDVKIEGPGVYRTELYRDDLGSPFDTTPWIISNPVFVTPRDNKVEDEERPVPE